MRCGEVALPLQMCMRAHSHVHSTVLWMCLGTAACIFTMAFTSHAVQFPDLARSRETPPPLKWHSRPFSLLGEPRGRQHRSHNVALARLDPAGPESRCFMIFRSLANPHPRPLPPLWSHTLDFAYPLQV